MATYKVQFASEPNLNKIANDLTAYLGAGKFETAYQADTRLFELQYPSSANLTVLDQILNGHRPEEPLVSPGVTTLVGPGTGIINSGGMQSNLPNLNGAVINLPGGGTVLNQNYGDITVDTSTSPATITGSGFREVWPPVEVAAGVFAVWFAAKNGVVTKYITIAGVDSSGAGAVMQDENGITFASPDVYTAINYIKWKTLDGVFSPGIIGAFPDADTPDRGAGLFIDATAESGGQGNATLSLSTSRTNTINSFNMLRINDFYGDTYSPLFPMFQYTDRFGNYGTLHVGDYASYYKYDTDNTARDVYTRTIRANSIGANGFIKHQVALMVQNTSGTPRAYVALVSFGGTTLAQRTSANIASGSFGWCVIETWMTNRAATNLQLWVVRFTYVDNSGTATTAVAATTAMSMNGGGADTTAHKDLKVTVTLGASSANLSCEAFGSLGHGPLYA